MEHTMQFMYQNLIGIVAAVILAIITYSKFYAFYEDFLFIRLINNYYKYIFNYICFNCIFIMFLILINIG